MRGWGRGDRGWEAVREGCKGKGGGRGGRGNKGGEGGPRWKGGMLGGGCGVKGVGLG